MDIKHDQSLSEMTTFRMGGKIANCYYPESKEELWDLVDRIETPYIVGGGQTL